MKYIKAETLKFRRTALGKLWFILPAVSAVLAFFLTSDYFQVDNYCWWYSMLLAGYIPFVCGLIIQKDRKSGSRQQACLPVDQKKCWRAKTMTGAGMLVLADGCIVVLGVLGGLLMEMTGREMITEIGFIQGTIAMIVLTVTLLWQIPLWMWVAEKTGLFITLLLGTGVNMAGCIIFAIKDSWYLMPFSVPARLMIPLLKILPNGLLAREGSFTYRPELLDGNVIWKGLLISVFLFLLLEAVTEIWYAEREVK